LGLENEYGNNCFSGGEFVSWFFFILFLKVLLSETLGQLRQKWTFGRLGQK